MLPFDPPQPTRTSEPGRLEPYPDAWLEGVTDPSRGPGALSEARETLELAFIAALQQLPPRQRAVLVLRDVLGFRAPEVADMLGSSVDAVKAALQRARATLEQTRPPDRDAAPPPCSPAEERLVQRFADAFQADDIDGVVALLTRDAWLTILACTAGTRRLASGKAGQPNRCRTRTKGICGSSRASTPCIGRSRARATLNRRWTRLSAVLIEVFACDRAWLLEAHDDTWIPVMERARPEYPGGLGARRQAAVDRRNGQTASTRARRPTLPCS